MAGTMYRPCPNMALGVNAIAHRNEPIAIRCRMGKPLVYFSMAQRTLPPMTQVPTNMSSNVAMTSPTSVVHCGLPAQTIAELWCRWLSSTS
jgi:hypothetical protein